MNTQRPLSGALIIVIVGIGLGIGFNTLHPKPIPWKGEKKKTVTLETTNGDVTLDPPAEREEREHKLDPPRTQMVPDEEPAQGGSRVGTEDLYADIPESEYPIEISTAKAKELYDRGGLLVLDAREHTDYADGHIKGAEAAPADEMVGDVDWLDRTSQDPRPILVYCDGGDCELSLNLGFELNQSGHRKILVYKDGFPAWNEAGHPVSTGETP